MRRAAAGILFLLSPVFLLANRLPGLSSIFDVLRGLPAEAALDYSREPSGFAPLSDAYFSRLYGEPFPNLVGGIDPRSGDRPASSSVGGEARYGEVSDSFEGAIEVHRLPFASSGDTRSATRQAGEPTSCSPAGGTVWYHFKPATNARLIAGTFGSDHPITLGVFRGSSMSSLEQVGCMTDARGNAFAAFPAERATSYYFQVTSATGGAMMFSLVAAGEPMLVSTGPTELGLGDSREGTASDDGRYVAFASADLLTPGADGACGPAGPAASTAYDAAAMQTLCSQIFVRDLLEKTTTLVSSAPGGTGGNGRSYQAAISGDGRYVVFQSAASDLVPGDTNGITDIFLRDLIRRTTQRVSVTEDGEQSKPRKLMPDSPDPGVAYENNRYPVISRHGEVIAFETMSPNLSGDSRDCETDSYCHTVIVVDRRQGTVRNACLTPDGRLGSDKHACNIGSLSATGRYLVLQSFGDNQFADSEPKSGVFVRDLQTRRTARVSLDNHGTAFSSEVWCRCDRRPPGGRYISADGRWVVFYAMGGSLTGSDHAVFVRDRLLGVTTRVSPSTPDVDMADTPVISDDGSMVVFTIAAQNESEDQNGESDVYLRNRRTGLLVRINNGYSVDRYGGTEPTLSSDGSTVVFSTNDRLTGEDADDARDVYAWRLPSELL